ncbi:hypothetical protein OIY81_1914 [Cryptosporidium canis]|uniref:ER membrane protein complex subunit 10 n=1 Tax=Cryptosporidium canis TaxID=195482 RepID=A0ABQ8P7A4_9CRYT|nr:hypothetical protein OJ252_1892 [Cryptosporidium canis]KAJ1610875.1 hypothetical protein OIY81_1914 [Cryptosporidium canis]
MYFLKGFIFVLSLFVCGALSALSVFLDIELHCNDHILKERLLLDNYGDGPFFKMNPRCTSENGIVKVTTPESRGIAVSKLTSNIVLQIKMSDGQIIGVNMVEGETEGSIDYVFKQIKILEIGTIPDISLEASYKKADDQKIVETQPSFLRKYWWLIAIGFITYSVLTVDPNLVEPNEGSSSNGQLQQVVHTNRKSAKKVMK